MKNFIISSISDILTTYEKFVLNRKFRNILFFIILFGLLLFVTCNSSGDSSMLNKSGTNTGDGDFQTGEEILLYADEISGVTNVAANPAYTRYTWYFNDINGTDATGRSVTFTYTIPGEYTITLEVIPGTIVDGELTYNSNDAAIFTKKITVGGNYPVLNPLTSYKPILHLNFEDVITDSSDGANAVSWVDNSPGKFVNGISGKALDLSGGKGLRIDKPSLLSGRGEFTISFWAKLNSDAQSVNNVFSQVTSNSIVMMYTLRNLDAENGIWVRIIEGEDILLNTQNFSSTKSNQKWQHYIYSYSSSVGGVLYINNVKVASHSTASTLVSSNQPLYIGNNGSSYFDGIIDDFRIYDRALTEQEAVTSFEVIHTDFHARVAQWIFVDIPEFVMSNPDYRLYAAVTGGDLGSPYVLVNKENLQSREKFLLRNNILDGSPDDYILTVQLLDSSGNLLFEKKESFAKTYDGNPKVGIDENNAICIDGVPFFPVMPWGVNNEEISGWTNKGYSNAFKGEGFYPGTFTIPSYKTYLDLVGSYSFMVAGPATSWDGILERSLDKMEAYLKAFKDHDSQMIWAWWDEPELSGVSASQVRSWTALNHQIDPRHPVSTCYMGHPYADSEGSYWETTRRRYTFGYNSKLFGVRRAVTDIVAFDYYPLDNTYIKDNTTKDTMKRLEYIINRITDENLGLIPVLSAIETADAKSNQDTPWKPSPEQLEMITWFNIVHGVKGIVWFQYFDGTPSENLAYMAKFVRQIKELTPAVLGPESNVDVSVSCVPVDISNSGDDRVDFIIREYNDKIYIFAVRVSEFAQQDSSITTTPPPADDYPITATFTVSADVSESVDVYDEGRTITVTDGIFSDNFEPYAVHIYIIDKN